MILYPLKTDIKDILRTSIVLAYSTKISVLKKEKRSLRVINTPGTKAVHLIKINVYNM